MIPKQSIRSYQYRLNKNKCLKGALLSSKPCLHLKNHFPKASLEHLQSHTVLILLAGFELHETNPQQVRCVACYEANPAGTGGNWMKRSSIKGHLNTAIHINNAEALSVQKFRAQEEQAQVDAAYTGIANMNIDSFNDPNPATELPLNDKAQGSLPLWAYLDMENTRTLDPETERKNIQHQFQQILIQELFLDDTSEEDGSETNIIEALSNFGCMLQLYCFCLCA